MRLCHATALALLGWYLMIPPIVPSPGQSLSNREVMKRMSWFPDSNARLGRWSISGSYDDATACEKLKQLLISAGKECVSPYTWTRAFCAAATEAQCIASDDPRVNDR
jgi:hypothetical protein